MDLDWSLTILTLTDMINGTEVELHCGDFPDLEMMKVIVYLNWMERLRNVWELSLSLILGLELLSRGGGHSSNRQFWCLG